MKTRVIQDEHDDGPPPVGGNDPVPASARPSGVARPWTRFRIRPWTRVSPPPQRTRIIRRGLGLTASAFSVVFYCLSLTPSLLPRTWLLQAVVSGLTAAIGYAFGAIVGALVRKAWRRPAPRATRIAWRVLFLAAPLVGLLFLALGTRWQQELRARVGMSRMETYDIVRIVAVSVLTFLVLLLVARTLRLATRRLAGLFGWIVPKPLAYGAGLLVVLCLFVGFVRDFLVGNAVTVVSEVASLTNGGTSPGVIAPRSPLRSGSPASAVPYTSLGRQGRDFVASGPSVQDIARFSASPAVEPVRVYVGLDSAGTAEERARMAMAELERTGAFDRAVLAVITATGTGWVDEQVTDSLEYMYGGDTAVVAMQYSYLPSWLSFMVDQSKVTETASALIGAVQAKWAAMPPQTRPKLVLFGESLGSYGTENTYRNLSSMAGAVDGVLLVGPPFANPIWQQLVAGRKVDSPVWRPVYEQDSRVAFAQDAAALRTAPGPRPKVVYLQNSSDPIVWWSPSLLVQPPDWLDDPRGPDVSPDMRWYPGITFWQTVVDLVFATDVPSGHGHRYGSSVADGWAAMLPPPGWTDADTVRLRALLDAQPD